MGWLYEPHGDTRADERKEEAEDYRRARRRIVDERDGMVFIDGRSINPAELEDFLQQK